MSLASNNIHDEGAFALAQNTDELSFLNISYNRISPAGIKALESSPTLAGRIFTDGNISDLKKTSRLKHIAIVKSYCDKVTNLGLASQVANM